MVVSRVLWIGVLFGTVLAIRGRNQDQVPKISPLLPPPFQADDDIPCSLHEGRKTVTHSDVIRSDVTRSDAFHSEKRINQGKGGLPLLLSRLITERENARSDQIPKKYISDTFNKNKIEKSDQEISGETTNETPDDRPGERGLENSAPSREPDSVMCFLCVAVVEEMQKSMDDPEQEQHMEEALENGMCPFVPKIYNCTTNIKVYTPVMYEMIHKEMDALTFCQDMEMCGDPRPPPPSLRDANPQNEPLKPVAYSLLNPHQGDPNSVVSGKSDPEVVQGSLVSNPNAGKESLSSSVAVAVGNTESSFSVSKVPLRAPSSPKLSLMPSLLRRVKQVLGFFLTSEAVAEITESLHRVSDRAFRGPLNRPTTENKQEPAQTSVSSADQALQAPTGLLNNLGKRLGARPSVLKSQDPTDSGGFLESLVKTKTDRGSSLKFKPAAPFQRGIHG